MCSGTTNFKRDKAGVLPLTEWLHELFQNLANRSLDKPVTFGDLWNNGGDMEKERDIELVLMTTNITRGISHRFPFVEGSWGQLFFRKTEFDELFPQSVVNWMMSHSAAVRHEGTIEVPNDFHPIPAAPDLPILLGARMSLSFPILLSAVPLYAANVTATNKVSSNSSAVGFQMVGLPAIFQSTFSMRRSPRAQRSASILSRKTSPSATPKKKKIQ
jgi:hypothetical protein